MPSNQNPRRQYARNPHNRKPDDRKPGTHQLDNASIGDRVFFDSNGNGIQDQGEIGIAGSTVKLLDASGHVIATDVTDAYGNYQFSQLAAGDYRVMFVQPEGFTPSPFNQGTDDTLDSDADPDNGLMTDIITLGFCEKNDTIDAGFVEIALGTLEIVNFEFVFQNPDAASITDKILTQRLVQPNEDAEFVETALLIPELGESFSQLLTLTANGGDVEGGTLTLTISNPFVDVTSVLFQGSAVNLITSQTDNGEQQVTTIKLPSTLLSGDEIVLEVVSTVTNAITDTDESTPVDAITTNPLKEFDFEFALVDNPNSSDDLGDATFEGKIYTSQRFFDTAQGSSEYDLLEINNYLIEASVSDVSSSLEAEVFTVAGNLIEGTGGANPGTLHTLYFSEISGDVDPEKKKKNQTASIPPLTYSDPTVVDDFFLEWEPRPGIDISDFVDASGTDGYQLWLDLVRQGIFIREFSTTVSKTGTPAQLSTDTYSQTTIAGNIVDPDNLPSLPSFIALTFGQNENQTLSTKATQDGEIIEISQGLPGRPAPNAGPFEIFAVDSPDANPKKANFVDKTSFERYRGIGIIDGDDSNTTLQQHIDGDEILGISVTGFVGRDALISINCPNSKSNVEIKVEAYRNSYLVDSELFSLGSSHLSNQKLDFTSNGLFDTLYLSAGNSDTKFTFQLVELTALESVA